VSSLMCQSSVLLKTNLLLWSAVTRDCDMFNASDVSDAADDSEYWQIISQICNLVILCDGSDIMILFLLCLKRWILSLVLS
jgi:hypothetical protein